MCPVSALPSLIGAMTGKSLARIMNYVGSVLPVHPRSDGSQRRRRAGPRLRLRAREDARGDDPPGQRDRYPRTRCPRAGACSTSTVIGQILLDNQNALDKLAEGRRGAGVAVGQVLLKTGDAKDVINQTAIELGADLIVMSTHGRSGITRALLGSVTETVVRSAPCPVLTVRIHDKQKSDRDAA